MITEQSAQFYAKSASNHDRVYDKPERQHDLAEMRTHVAEALHCHPGRHLWQVLGPFPPAHTVLQHRLRMNGFLSRWLEYLGEQGHSIGTLEQDDSGAQGHALNK